jgi:hypothetical protein
MGQLVYLTGAEPGGLHAQVIRAADGRCQCTGRCGTDHLAGEGRCLIEHGRRGQVLLAVPRALAVSTAAAARLPASGLMALCVDCYGGARREAVKLPARDAPAQDALPGLEDL